MKRIDGPGATVANLFTNGNPGTGTPATTVEDDWLNNVQEEIATLIEAQGIALNGASYTQLAAAITKMVKGSVGASASAFTIVNNQVAAASITGLVFDKTVVKSARIFFDLYRKNNTLNYNEVGHITVCYNPLTDGWVIATASVFDDAGVTFSVTAAGQIQYVSTSMGATSYVGAMRWSNVVQTLI